jgi:hypothetical protein
MDGKPVDLPGLADAIRAARTKHQPGESTDSLQASEGEQASDCPAERIRMARAAKPQLRYEPSAQFGRKSEPWQAPASLLCVRPPATGGNRKRLHRLALFGGFCRGVWTCRSGQRYRHAHALGLFPKRQRNVRAALERIIEKAGEVDVTASAVVAAVQAYSKINAAGEWIDRTETVSMNDLFEKMTTQELESYAQTGELPEWFKATVGASELAPEHCGGAPEGRFARGLN